MAPLLLETPGCQTELPWLLLTYFSCPGIPFLGQSRPPANFSVSFLQLEADQGSLCYQGQGCACRFLPALAFSLFHLGGDGPCWGEEEATLNL